MERQKVSLGENLAGSNADAFTYWLSDSGQGWQCPPPRASARPRLTAAPASSSPRHRGTADPRKGGDIRCCHFCRSQIASGCHPDPTATAAEARPANLHPPPGSPLPDPRSHLPPVLSGARP